jgi:flagellar hook-associated protein 1 FlgK
VGAGTQIYDSSGNDVTSGLSGGSLGGQLQAQDVDLPAVTTALDSLAYQVGSNVNAQNMAGQTSAGVAGAAIFSLPAGAAGSAAAISVIPTDPGAIATASVGEGATGNTNVNALANLQTATDSNGDTMNGNLAAMLSNVGSTSSSLQEQTTVQTASLTQLTTQQSTLSGVDLDTEASNLTVYQRSYQAAAQVLTVVNQLMAAAINLGTETTVS